MNRRRSLPVILATLLTLGGCGIPLDSEPRPVQPPPGPAQALATRVPENSQTGTAVETVCLVRGASIVPVKRRAGDVPAVEAVMRDLLAGPTDAERANGFSSALPGTTVVDNVVVDNGVAVVAMGTGLDDTGRNDEVLAIGQVVCTMDARSDVTGVSFVHQGETIRVPRGDGSLSKGPLTTADYANLLAHE